MADDLTVKGSDAEVIEQRMDDLGSSVKVLAVKLMLGSAGVEDTLVDSGPQTKANSVPVTLPSDLDDEPVTRDSEVVDVAVGGRATQ